jgi:mannosyltransferase OCH1-like enzyme
MTAVMVYSFWDKPDQSPIQTAIADWQTHFPEFQVIGDPDIEKMIDREFPQHLDLYRAIRIPTCKSDVAILLSLYCHGGLYIDIHCGVRNADGVRQMISSLASWEIILYNKDFRRDPRPADVLRPLNSVIVARPGTQIMHDSAAMAFANLAAHFERERQTDDFVPYDIWSLTGPGVLEHTICYPPLEQWGPPQGLRTENANKVCFVLEGADAPIGRYMFHTYNPPGTHWSLRQKSERLFDTKRRRGKID